MADEKTICVVCAWRGGCEKKYSFSGLRCVDFVRDVTLKAEEEPEKREKGLEKN